MALLDGKVVVVTGGASGIGEAMVKRFCAEGARVVLGDVDDAGGLRVAEQHGAQFLHLDVRLPEHWQALEHLLGSDYGRLDALMNNAGIVSNQSIVEADVSTSDTPFANLPACEALEERISEEQLQNLQHISQEMGISPSLFSTQPLWQIAMVLQATQAQKLGLRAEYGIDYQLLQAAKQQHKPVIELEGAENQIAMLLQLPDKGLALLDDTLTHWHTNARLLQQMMSWWLNAPPQNNDITLPNTFSQSLYDVLMHQRNLAWRDKLRAMPPGRYVVAVGALHLYGEGNLPQMLR